MGCTLFFCPRYGVMFSSGVFGIPLQISISVVVLCMNLPSICAYITKMSISASSIQSRYCITLFFFFVL